MHIRIQKLFTIAIFEQREKQNSIDIIGNSSSIINVASHVQHRVPGDAFSLEYEIL